MEINFMVTQIPAEEQNKPQLLQKKLTVAVSIHGDKDLMDNIRSLIEAEQRWECR